MSVDLHRFCKLWSFSTYLLPEFLFSHVLDAMELLIMTSFSKPVLCSPSSKTLPDLCQSHLEPSFRGAMLLLTERLRCGSIAFHSSFLPLSFSSHFLLSFCPNIPRFWEFWIYAYCSLSLSHISFTKYSGEDLLFPQCDYNGSEHSQPHWQMSTALETLVSKAAEPYLLWWEHETTILLVCKIPSIHNFF